jgi:serine/threonine protein phosphatase PrpC
MGIFEMDTGEVCLAVADGVGGLPKGREASEFVIQKIGRWIERKNRSCLEDLIKDANKELLKEIPRAATTLSVTLVKPDGSVLSSHAGDSLMLVVGQRGRVKLRVDSHSPVGVSETLGLIDEREALHHPKRHYLNNMLGDPAFWLEKHEAKLAARDTVLIASDGLWDNLYVSEIIEIIQSGELEASAQTLAETAISRMTNVQEGLPSKPDDLTFVLFRLNATGLCEDAERHVDSGGR